MRTVGCRRVLLKTGPRPSGPRPTAHDGPAAQRPEGPSARGPRPPTAPRPGGPAARWPSPDFPQSFCPAVHPRTCTELQRAWACKMDDGEFEFVYHFNNHFNPIRPFRCMLLSEKRCHSLFIRLFTEPDREEVHSQTI